MTTAIAIAALVLSIIALVAVIDLWWRSLNHRAHHDSADQVNAARLLQHGKEIGALRRKLKEPPR